MPDPTASVAASRPTDARLLTVTPAGPHAATKARLAAAVEAARDEIVGLSQRIHANPEPAFEEVQAASWIADVLRAHGFAVEHPAGSLATAIRATHPGRDGATGPRIGILAEYDALPGLGHGCGHNTMAASGVGAAIALAAIADELPGEIVFLGTPAEERGSGKAIMIEDGLFDGLDAALLYHPCDRDHVESHPARVGGHRRRLHRSPGARLERSVDGPQRPRCAHHAVQRRSACGASSCARRHGSTGSSARAARRPTSSRSGRSPGS